MTDNTNETEATTPETTTAEVTAETPENTPETKEAVSKTVALGEFYGQKAGMTRLFNNDGNHVPVTVIKLIPNFVTQVKTTEGKEGYNAYQVGYGEKREKLLTKPNKGHLKKAKVTNNVTRFFEVKAGDVDTKNLGKEVDYTSFGTDSYIDVTSVSKGKGFQGVMKKFGFSGGPATHGSHFHRTTGSIGNRATPGKVFKLKKMPGHLGAKQRTVQNLKVVEVNQAEGYMLVKGSVPGHKNSFVKVKKAIKK